MFKPIDKSIQADYAQRLRERNAVNRFLKKMNCNFCQIATRSREDGLAKSHTRDFTVLLKSMHSMFLVFLVCIACVLCIYGVSRQSRPFACFPSTAIVLGSTLNKVENFADSPHERPTGTQYWAARPFQRFVNKWNAIWQLSTTICLHDRPRPINTHHQTCKQRVIGKAAVATQAVVISLFPAPPPVCLHSAVCLLSLSCHSYVVMLCCCLLSHYNEVAK